MSIQVFQAFLAPRKTLIDKTTNLIYHFQPNSNGISPDGNIVITDPSKKRAGEKADYKMYTRNNVDYIIIEAKECRLIRCSEPTNEPFYLDIEVDGAEKRLLEFDSKRTIIGSSL